MSHRNTGEVHVNAPMTSASLIVRELSVRLQAGDWQAETVLSNPTVTAYGS